MSNGSVYDMDKGNGYYIIVDMSSTQCVFSEPTPITSDTVVQNMVLWHHNFVDVCS